MIIQWSRVLPLVLAFAIAGMAFSHAQAPSDGVRQDIPNSTEDGDVPQASVDPQRKIDPGPPHAVSVLRALDKVTGRVTQFEARVGEVARFGTLEIIPRACHKRPPEEPPESTAFLDVTEVRKGESPKTVFRGWMFASSPALSAMEHAVYDVWVVDCKQPMENAGQNAGRGAQ